MSSFPVSKTSAIVDPEDETAEPLLPALNGFAAPAQPPAASNTVPSKPTEAFSIEKEQAEIESLTVDEILDAERDLMGLSTGMNQMTLQGQGQEKPTFDANKVTSTSTSTNAQIHEDPIATSTDLAALEVALLALPPENKRYYLEACVRCPNEVADERKAAFLETDQLDASAAALRLCTYWSVRVATFGDTLAYLPMTLDGAMREDVDAMIRYCPMERLPKPDAYGRQMTFWDSGRRNPEVCTLEQEHRGMFYLVHTMTLDLISRRRGWVAIATGKNQNQSNFSWETAQYLKDLYSTVMPIKMRSCHIAHPSSILYYGIYPLLKGVIGRDMRLRWKLYPTSTTNEELMDQLTTYGIPRSRLPVDIGGDLRLDFEQFLADYSVIESLQYMDSEAKKCKKLVANAATAAPKQPAQQTNTSLLSHPEVLLISSEPASIPKKPKLPSTADDMITIDDLKKAASGMNAMSPPPFTGNSEADVARTHILSNFSSQLLKARSLASSRSSISAATGDGSSGKPPALLASLSLPPTTIATANPWSIDSRPISSALDDLDSFDFDFDEMQNVGAL